MSTGALSGHNAVRYGLGMPMLILPKSTAIVDIISYANYKMATKEEIDIPLQVQNTSRECR